MNNPIPPRETLLTLARETAAQFHSGQCSAMYAFASTGTVLPDLAKEVKDCFAKRLTRNEEIALRQLYAIAAVLSFPQPSKE